MPTEDRRPAGVNLFVSTGFNGARLTDTEVTTELSDFPEENQQKSRAKVSFIRQDGVENPAVSRGNFHFLSPA